MGPLPRISPVLPTTDAQWQAVMREFNALTARMPTDDYEWQAAMRLVGLADVVTPKLPTTDAEWQTGFVSRV